MTVPVQTPVTSSVANGVTTVFPFTFKILNAADLTVTVDGTIVTTGFSVTGVGEDEGGSVVFDVAPANGKKIIRYLNPVLARVTDYQQFGDWLAPIVNADFDRIWLTIQYLSQALIRAIKLPVDSLAGQEITEDATNRSNKVITFDVDGNVALKSGTELIPEVDTAVTNAIAAAASAASSASSADTSADAAAASALAASTSPVAAPTHAASSKATPVDADEIPLIDSTASFGLKRLTWANLKATLKTYFDGLYITSRTGEIFLWPFPTAPSGALAIPLVATNVSRTTYANLHEIAAAQGYPWGSGDGSTTFGIPYLQADGAWVQANGNVGTVTTGEVKDHFHTVPFSSVSVRAGGAGSDVQPGGSTSTSSTGGTANLAAGSRGLWCIWL